MPLHGTVAVFIDVKNFAQRNRRYRQSSIARQNARTLGRAKSNLQMQNIFSRLWVANLLKVPNVVTNVNGKSGRALLSVIACFELLLHLLPLRSVYNFQLVSAVGNLYFRFAFHRDFFAVHVKVCPFHIQRHAFDGAKNDVFGKVRFIKPYKKGSKQGKEQLHRT